MIFDFPGCVVPGAGALEVAIADALMKHKPSVKGRSQLGVQAFADALLIIPKVGSLWTKTSKTFLSSVVTINKTFQLSAEIQLK